ncbi:MAG TPA: GlxA family transcriptional regulator [Afipia sp.]|nr:MULTISPECIES: GlxA family transcriptional regulator [unclassified Afipia]MAH67836.1 GlxA family transcriptional regulator [Afipia sp.]OUX63045.1 MAG: AraC family transcriptional regulator [Afipia sp. TMED4]HAO39688.1 GlxA family transcriptional regulator [Afipia sp.]HAP09745.1 GlxA family transcriptional regulator [Afipia sp.]HAP47301.1 GlxA family transcriptional regulator [Afipia sp.]
MKRIGLVIFPGFQILDLAAISVFELANMVGYSPSYEIELLSEYGGPVASSSGVPIETKPFSAAKFDTVLVTGWMSPVPASAGLLAFMSAASKVSRRIASICTGAFVLAEAGILDGRRATTHWAFARDMQARFPKIKVQEDKIFIVDGSVWTSAGMTSCIDLCLAMVEDDLGADIARGIARKMVVYHRRTGGQSQFSALLELQPKSDRIQDALAFAKKNLKTDLSVEVLAEAARLSPRQFSRAFRSETGQSPAKAVENLRVEAARLMMEEAQHPVDVIARETGFSDPERMRRAFLRAFGQPPQAIKRAARRAAA